MTSASLTYQEERYIELESDGLLAINSRSTCITFLSTRQLPCTEDLLIMCLSNPAQSVVVGPQQQVWYFPSMRKGWRRSSWTALKYKGGNVVFN